MKKIKKLGQNSVTYKRFGITGFTSVSRSSKRAAWFELDTPEPIIVSDCCSERKHWLNHPRNINMDVSKLSRSSRRLRGHTDHNTGSGSLKMRLVHCPAFPGDFCWGPQMYNNGYKCINQDVKVRKILYNGYFLLLLFAFSFNVHRVITDHIQNLPFEWFLNKWTLQWVPPNTATLVQLATPNSPLKVFTSKQQCHTKTFMVHCNGNCYKIIFPSICIKTA